jgi:small-conductance mechanosensitive channel
MMLKSRWERVFIFALCLNLFLVAIALVELAEAQDSATAVPESTPTPQVTPTAVPESTPTPQVTPFASGSAGENFAAVAEGLLDASWQDILQVLLSVVVIFLVAYFGGKLLIYLLQRITRRTETSIDNELLEVIKPQISWFILAMGFQFATNRFEFLDAGIKSVLQTVYFLIYLFVITVSLWRISDYSIDRYVSANKKKLNENLVDQIMPLTKRLFHIVLIILAMVIMAAHFGIDLLAISAALGLSGLAIALAAKDTITNIISGIVLMVSGPFNIGDRLYVPGLDTWADVVDIGIRSTTVVTRDNRLVIVPNSAIVDDTIVNYSLPDSTFRLETDIGLGEDVDIPQVREMIRETVRKLDGVLPDKPVDVWFIEFADAGNTFRVRWWVADYAERRRSTDLINTSIQELANREDIDMPNPTFTVENEVRLKGDDHNRIEEIDVT